ncbi:MAG: TAXI family TRAP transporter solute-binding subunit [Candidatus Riflebacteria bacterium]|nr:TAXI family TRAP transporter solute-binding subunit [Candidatus Riflebacteria bacterium]
MRVNLNNKVYNLFLIIALALFFSSVSKYVGADSKFRTALLKKFYIIGTGGINGVYYSLGSAIARLFNSRMEDILTISEPTNGSVSNIELLRSKEVTLALVQSDIAYDAYFGKGIFEGKPFPNLRILAALYSESVHLIVLNDSPIKTPLDLKGKQVSIGEEGSGTALNAKILLDECGIKSTDFHPKFLSLAKATDALKSGYIDAIFFTGGVPVEGFSLLSNEKPIRLISLPDYNLKIMLDGRPYFTSETILAGAYRGVTENVNTLGLRALLITTDSFESEKVETILQIIFSNSDYLTSISNMTESIDLKKALVGVDSKMLHQAAAAFYKSHGIF